MAEISRTALFGKLNPIAYKSIEGATVFCKLRGNPYVELQHWLFQILQTQDSDLHRLVKHYGIDPSVLVADLQNSLDRLRRSGSGCSAAAASGCRQPAESRRRGRRSGPSCRHGPARSGRS